METPLRSPPIPKEEPDAPTAENADSEVATRSWHPLHALLQLRAFEALRYRDYRLIWYGQVFASMGTWMDQVTRGWLIYELTDSALQLGLVRGIQAIPFLLLSPVAGSTADRYSRKMQMVVAQVVNGLVYAATALLIYIDEIEPWHVYVTGFLMAVAQVFQQPARAAMIADAVPPSQTRLALTPLFSMSRAAPARRWRAFSSPSPALAARIWFKRFFSFWQPFGRCGFGPGDAPRLVLTANPVIKNPSGRALSKDGNSAGGMRPFARVFSSLCLRLSSLSRSRRSYPCLRGTSSEWAPLARVCF